MFARRELLYLTLELVPAFRPDMWTVINRAATANHLDHDIQFGVEYPYFFVPYSPL